MNFYLALYVDFICTLAFTVNLEIFARILFSRIALKEIFAM